jgi:hypothetical protein
MDWVVGLVVVAIIVAIVIILWFMGVLGRSNAPASAAPAAPAAPAGTAASAIAGPYGPGSAAPLADGGAPAGYTIKGNADSMLFHTADSPYYGRTKAEAWFATEGDAVRAGFRRWDRKD